MTCGGGGGVDTLRLFFLLCAGHGTSENYHFTHRHITNSSHFATLARTEGRIHSCFTRTKIPVNYDLSICSSLWMLWLSPSLPSLAPLQSVLLTNSKELNLHIFTFTNQCVLGNAHVVLTMMYSVIKVPGVYLITGYRLSGLL